MASRGRNQSSNGRRGRRAGKPPPLPLAFRPLTPQLMDALAQVLRGGWGAGCWCLYPRLTAAQARDLPGEGPPAARRRAAMARLAARPLAPGLVAFEGEDPIGWVAIAPRRELARIAASRATPPVDGENVWVIPCVTVRKGARGRGVAIALIGAAVDYAAGQGARIIEAYPRAGKERTGDDNAFFGTEAMFRHAGFKVVRPPLSDVPRTWTPRVAMRITRQQGAAGR